MLARKSKQKINFKRSVMAFLPQGYQEPKSASNNYMKLEQGENKIRILSQPILGWIDWIDKKPMRYRFENKPDKSYDPTKPIKHFWAFIVWNYRAEEIQILEITQAKIRKALQSLSEDSDWGAPYDYDIKIIKSGEKMETEYQVNPCPHTPVHEYLREEFEAKPCYLEALYAGEDPFDKKFKNPTPSAFEAPVDFIIEDKINAEEALALQNVLAQCDETYRSKVMDFLRKNHNVQELTELTKDVYKRVYEAAEKKVSSINMEGVL